MADDLADLYAIDGVHEFGFTAPGGVREVVDREQVRQLYRNLWTDPPITISTIDNLAVHATTDPATIISEWVAACDARRFGLGGSPLGSGPVGART